MEDFAIKLDNVSKSFKLPHEKNTTLKGAVVNFAKRGYELQHVFTNLSLTVPKGEFLGILGRNGSGKSTLLKTLSGIYSSDSGTITINGKLTPFIELGVGFNPELSGRDNVYLNGALLGFSRKEIDLIYSDIVSFAELEKFMDQKLKNYSSGMQVRLAFSIAIRADTDILVLDEVLAVGDEAFQRKCYDYFNELKLRGKTVILVTHDMSAVKRFCTKAMVIDKGRIIYEGDTEGATTVYRDLNLEGSKRTLAQSNRAKIKKTSSILGIKTTDDKYVEKNTFKPNEKIRINAEIKISNKIKHPAIQFWFNNPGGTAITSVKISTKELLKQQSNLYEKMTVSWLLDGIFNDGMYLITAEISDSETGEVYEVLKEVCEFGVVGWESPYVLVHTKKNISVVKAK
jgi:ABC-2 type transport system ATP-binding protein